MSFKSKLGTILHDAVKVVETIDPELQIFEPLISAISPKTGATVVKVDSEIGQIVGIIGVVETLGVAVTQTGGSLTPAQKRAAAADMIAQVILRSAALAGHNVENKDKFTAACETIAGGFSDALGSFSDSGVKTS